MERVIDITRDAKGTVTFAAVEAGNGESVFWRNNDTKSAHWPAILYQEIPAFQGLNAPPTSPEFPIYYAQIVYGCQIPGHEQEAGTITIYPALAIATKTPGPIPVNTAFSLTLAATGGKSVDTTGKSLYVWSILGNDLPAGLTLSNGIIAGTPTATGTTNLTLQVTDGLGNAVTAAIALTVQ